MVTRSIENREREEFIQLYPDPGAQEWLNRLFEHQATKPAWCFVIEEEGRYLGGAVYFQFGGDDAELALFGPTLPWEGRYLEMGEKLLTESLKEMQRQALRRIESRCDSDHPYHQEVRDVLERAGFQLSQEKECYVLTELGGAHDPGPLAFRSLDEVGEERFVEAIQQVTVNTLDREDQNEVDAQGAEGAAREYFDLLASIDDDPDRWIVAYDSKGHLVGLVVAQRLSEETGGINYIGVTPEFRGKNYSRDLLVKAARLFASDESVVRVVAEIDVENFPLAKTLLSLGYRPSKTMWVYHKDVEPVSGEVYE
jgi:RimJ/RimL family protein N-acetyltransferase